ncbi:toxin-antitoxin system HicB family antitoxin [Companilactobacillus mishanensis]|uniref:Toxin-antitoxin system HicB family antitoxin n=1 Tax=Companilactobacillus mishanensis TaxID=2486008 RepID=A0A5P0ZHN7_9LACO|nr:toxin-antitoxin system HicB family antitoxin [Companilactobacillus mishanensis]MQS45726.1 toxin-antitoxin system HicB family antitoxin [Companilactobacillus mishanensis]MQS52495.1 toxin-antitoxin system HicB family antitoxin [Companilactobacillus mishanensis]MQS89153.1 toxin-antitoxin system HicB family antitoxin [Companilactobacillus mishanensis]
MAEKKFLLRLDQDLYDRVVAKADAENRSVNKYIVHLLQEKTKDSTLENRQFVGQTVKGVDILPDSGLVSVSGIYYRYILSNTKDVDEKKMYTIIEATGNILTLKELK